MQGDSKTAQMTENMTEAIYRPKHNPWIIAITVTLATIMEVLDTSIANVALPHIAGSLGASQDESTWVITSYLVANAIILPVGAYLSRIVGRKRFYMSCVAIFGLSSLMCGLAPTLPALLFFRVLQGLGGGGLQPSEQAILADTFPPAKRGQAFAIYGLAVITAPIIGPTLGGWITDNYDWRWIFFINIPVAILSLVLTHNLVEDPPNIQRDVAEARQAGFQLDVIGFVLVALTFGSLEVVMDKGQEDDWFSSHLILVLTVLCIASFVAVILWELYQKRRGQRPILDLYLFGNRNFAVSFLMMLSLGFVLYGTTVLLPQFLQSVMGYTAEAAGMAMSAGGIATIIGMPLVGFLIGRMDGRYLIMCGYAVLAASLYHMTTIYLGISFSYAAWLRLFQSTGLAFLFVPINTLSYVGISREKNNDVSGLTNLARNIGGSAGTSFFTTVLARREQVHQQFLVSHVVESNPAYRVQLDALIHQALTHTASMSDAKQFALQHIYDSVLTQASVLSYIDVLAMFSLVAACMLPMAALLKKPPKHMNMPVH